MSAADDAVVVAVVDDDVVVDDDDAFVCKLFASDDTKYHPFVCRVRSLVSSLSTSLLENLLAFFGPGTGNNLLNDDNYETSVCVSPQLAIWTTEMKVYLEKVQQDEEQQDCDLIGKVRLRLSSVIDALVLQATEEAIKRWKLTTDRIDSSSLPRLVPPKAAQSTSFSLFSSMADATFSPLALIVTWDQIQEVMPAGNTALIRATVDRVLPLLKQVQHIDDILPDWDQRMAPLLQSFLSLQREQRVPDIDFLMDLLELHDRWLQQTQASPSAAVVEYSLLQIDLVQNLMSLVDLVAPKAANDTHNNDPSSSLLNSSSSSSLALQQQALTLIHSTWMYWMFGLPGAVFTPDARNAIVTLGTTLFDWSICGDAALLVPQYWRRLDPYAHWLQAWARSPSTHHLTPSAALDLVKQHTNPLSTAIILAQSSSLHLSASSSNYQDVYQTHILALLASLLSVLRVTQFPWQQVLVTSSSQDEAMMKLFDLYRQALVKASTTTNIVSSDSNNSVEEGSGDDRGNVDAWQSLCTDTMDIILLGCHAATSSSNVLTSLLQTVQTSDNAHIRSLARRYQ